MNNKKKVAVRLRERSTAFDEGLRYKTYLYLEDVNSTLTSNALYTKHANWEEWFMYKLQGAKLAKVLESLPGSVAAALGIMIPEPLSRPVSVLDAHGKVVESRPYSETPLPSLMKRNEAVFAASSFRFRNSDGVDISVPRARGLMSTILSLPSKRYSFMMSPERVPPSTAPEKEAGVLKMTKQ